MKRIYKKTFPLLSPSKHLTSLNRFFNYVETPTLDIARTSSALYSLKRCFLFFIFHFSLFTTFVCSAQDDKMQHFKDALYRFNEAYPSEKLYVQTDKTYYKQSEVVWYKGFLGNSTDNKPSTVSDVVYMELHDSWGNVVSRNEHQLVSGTFDGGFELSSDCSGGRYKVVGYTSWMKNWDDKYFFTKEINVQKVITPRLLLKLDFEKRAYGAGDEVTANLKVTDLNNEKTSGSIIVSTIRIGGEEYKTITGKSEDGEVSVRFNLPQDLSTTDGILQILVSDKGVRESITRSIPIVINKIEMRFFPESGELVAETENKVAFEVLNEFGKGADVSGEVIDDMGTQIAVFNSYHLGMGAFSFTPAKGRKYYARIITPAGNSDLKELPDAIDNGYILSLTRKEKDKTIWKIYSPKDNDDMFIITHTQGVVQYSKPLSLTKGNNSIEIASTDFPMGIAVFTLFDGTKEVAERLVFLNPDKRLKINLTTDKEFYGPDEEVKLSIETTDEKGVPIAANIGLAVVDEQILTMADDKQDNLLSYMMFSSELKGTIEEPSFYFDPEEPKAEEAIDYLMLTHGWRRFKWNDVLNSASGMEMKNTAERLGSVYGYVLDELGKPVQADVYLIEPGGRSRIAKLTTTIEGHFVFHNADLYNRVFVSTKLPNKVYLIKGVPVFADESLAGNTGDDDIIDLSQKADYKEESFAPFSTKNERFESDALYLEESVVIGYGVQRHTTTTSVVGYATSLHPNHFRRLQAAAGKAENDNSAITNRSISSIHSTDPPVYINDIAVEGTLLQALSMVTPTDIEQLYMLKSDNKSAVYGSRASNGVIFITTKKAFFEQKYKIAKPEYSSAVLPKREFYKHPGFTQRSHNFSQNNSTVYWDGKVVTGKDGKASLWFKGNINSSTFRITTEGLASSHGILGNATKRIVTREAFSIDAKVPIFAGAGDTIKIPVIVKNMAHRPWKVALNIEVDNPAALTLTNSKYMPGTVVNPHNPETFYISMLAGEETTDAEITIIAQSGRIKNSIKQKIHIRRTDFPYRFSYSGREMSDSILFTLPEHKPGTLKAEATSYIQFSDELYDGMEDILSIPHGCFEQLLSASFPNVFLLQLLKATDKINDKLQKQALSYIETGYKKLANYETKKTGGFEWYGGSPAHEMLTAYGLVHFYEMDKVYDKVDKKMTDRALDFLLSRRDGKGGFMQNRGIYGFAGAPINVNNAYIVYAFHEIEKGRMVDVEYQSALKEALESKDMYRMALLANAACHRKDMESYKKLISHFKGIDDLAVMQIEATIVRSSGESQNREAVAYWLMALLKNTGSYDHSLVMKCLTYIAKGKYNYGFGNTQTTSVCLQALTKYAIFTGTHQIKGDFALTVNGDKESVDLKKYFDKGENVVLPFADKLKNGANRISLDYTGTETGYPYVVNVSWYSSLPPSSDLCPLKLTTEIGATEIIVNETVRLSVKLKNTENEGKPMSVAIIGIPGGMSLQPWQLKEMQEKEVFDFYEIIDDNLVVYYRELGPNEEKVINLDLKAEIPGDYTGMASSAYLYYMDQHKHWIKGLKVRIKESKYTY